MRLPVVDVEVMLTSFDTDLVVSLRVGVDVMDVGFDEFDGMLLVRGDSGVVELPVTKRC